MNIIDSMYDLKWKLYYLKRDTVFGWQRARRGYSDQDKWNYNTWFISVTVPMLTAMRDHGCGYPSIQGAETPEEWHRILTEMIDGFTIWNYMMDGAPLEMEYKHKVVVKDDNGNPIRFDLTRSERAQVKLAFKNFVDYFNCLWD